MKPERRVYLTRRIRRRSRPPQTIIPKTLERRIGDGSGIAVATIWPRISPPGERRLWTLK